MGKALEASGRDIVYSVCAWSEVQPWRWAGNSGAHYWRTFEDITDSWDAVVAIATSKQAWNDIRTRMAGTTPTCSRSATAE